MIVGYGRSWSLLEGYDEDALVALPVQKDTVIALVVNMLVDA
ncbi:MAG: hypothetical protein U9O64_01760 [Campylobacterota bacterium]|nr:hypothetical protein [Campylobacterota bacterium]